MPQQPVEIRQFRGVFRHPNSFNVPDGAFEELNNVIIAKDDVLTRIRGWYTYYTPPYGTLNSQVVFNSSLFEICTYGLLRLDESGSSPNEVGAATVYGTAAVGVFYSSGGGGPYTVTVTSAAHGLKTGDVIWVTAASDTDAIGEKAITVTTADTFTYATTANPGTGTLTYYYSGIVISGSRRSRILGANKNLYFTTDNGVKKIESISDLRVRSAGIPQALDLRARAIDQDGAFVGNSQIGYRICFGRRDGNKNLLIGAPSDIVVINNSPFLATAGARVGNVVTVNTVTVDHGLGTSQFITVDNGTGVTPVPDGEYLVTVPGAASGCAYTWIANVVTVTSAAHGLPSGTSYAIIFGASDEGIAGRRQVTYINANQFSYSAAGASAGGTCGWASTTVFTFPDTAADCTPIGIDWTADRAVLLESSIPREIDTAADLYFAQVYRTSSSATYSASPVADFKLIEEIYLTAADIARKIFYYVDVVPELFRENAEELYTNPNSMEGESAANFRPPLCEDLAYFRDMAVYANTKSRHLLNLNLIDSAATAIAAGDKVETKRGSVTRIYTARSGNANDTATCWAHKSGATEGTIVLTAHGFSAGDIVYVSNVTGTMTEGEYTVLAAPTANAFRITTANAVTLTSCDVTGIRNSSGEYLFQLVPPTTSQAVGLRETARGLVRAINRDTSGFLYCNYTSGISGMPGMMRWQAFDFSTSFAVRATTAAAGTAFSPVLPSSFAAGTQVTSENDENSNVFFVSKSGEPEAVPLAFQYPVGARNLSILRSVSLKDTLLMVTDAGIYRVDGDSPYNLQIVPLDLTVTCLAPSSVATINNQAVLLSNQGLVLASSNSVQIVSRANESPIASVFGVSGLSTIAVGAAHESDRLYYLTTIAPNETTATETWVFNILNNTWTTTDVLMINGLVGPGDTLYWIDLNNKVQKQRRKHTKLDYTGQNYAVTVSSVATTKLAATISSASVVPLVGDVIVKSNVISIISGVTANGGASYTVTFPFATNLAATDSVSLYRYYTATIKTAPIHAGKVGIVKHWTTLHVHQRYSNISKLEITFCSQASGGDEVTVWDLAEVAGAGGWGFDPWGWFGWGLESRIVETYTTGTAPVITTWVPLFNARANWIQVQLEHKIAAEPLEIQAIDIMANPYGERISR